MASSANNAATAVSLQFRHIFGINTNVVDNLSFTDDDTLAYVAGECNENYCLKKPQESHRLQVIDDLHLYMYTNMYECIILFNF